MEQMSPLSRRRLLRALAATGAAALFRPQLASSQQARVLRKPIPSTGEELPAVGLGSWITFNVGNDTVARDACAEVMRAFFDSGGRLIDSSPMYGSSQKVIGYGLTKLNGPPSVFSADKVWISCAQCDHERRMTAVAVSRTVPIRNRALLSHDAPF
jgi:aryl-alcohol dehydrogenase-like predicted oxidoreductase